MTLQIENVLLEIVISSSRSPDVSCKKVTYEGLDGDKNLYVTFLAASEFIQSAIEQVNEMLFFLTNSVISSLSQLTLKIPLNFRCTLENIMSVDRHDAKIQTDLHFYLHNST